MTVTKSSQEDRWTGKSGAVIYGRRLTGTGWQWPSEVSYAPQDAQLILAGQWSPGSANGRQES